MPIHCLQYVENDNCKDQTIGHMSQDYLPKNL